MRSGGGGGFGGENTYGGPPGGAGSNEVSMMGSEYKKTVCTSCKITL